MDSEACFDVDTFAALKTVQAFEPGEERLNLEIEKVNLDIPQWMIDGLHRPAELIGATRQSIIKMWLAERLKTKGT